MDKHTAPDNTEIGSLTVEELVIKLRQAAPEDASTYILEIIGRFEPLLRRAWKHAAFKLEYQDFVQEVVFQLFRGLPGLRNSSAFPGYLRSIALRVATDSFRKQSVDPIANTDVVKDTIRAFDEELIRSIHIRYCLEMLQPGERAIIELGVIDGLSVKEIAEKLQVNEVTVRVRKFRAFKKLRRILLDEGKKLENNS